MNDSPTPIKAAAQLGTPTSATMEKFRILKELLVEAHCSAT